MGELEEAVALFVKALRLNPENAPSWAANLAVYYALLGREQEARVSLETFKKSGASLTSMRVMNLYPFKDRTAAERFAEGLLKAGLSGKLNDYLPGFKENQLTGEEVKKLFFGSTTTGQDFTIFGWTGQWSIDCRKNGEFIYNGPAPIRSDIGKTRIEGNTMCMRFQKNFGGIEFGMTVFRNPGGTYEDKDEYFMYSDLGRIIFSLVK
jgi:tetratricopeptide (TPR) repeat protein